VSDAVGDVLIMGSGDHSPGHMMCALFLVTAGVNAIFEHGVFRVIAKPEGP
jgi:hypothetical protein